MRYSDIGVLFSLVFKRNLEVDYVDVKTTYLNSDLKEEICCYQPEGYVASGKQKMICSLCKAIFDLKKPARQCNIKLKQILESANFQQFQSETCIFKWKDDNLFVGVYVDDLIVVNALKIKEFK